MNSLAENCSTHHLYADILGSEYNNTGIKAINYDKNATITIETSLNTLDKNTGNIVQVTDDNGNLSTTGDLIYYGSGNIPTSSPYWSSGVLNDGTYFLKNNQTNHISMYADPVTNQVTFDPPVGTGSWSGNATSDLNMNGFNIINSPSTSHVLTVQGTGHLIGSGTYTPANTSLITIDSDATNLNTSSTIVARDGAGNFSAGVITANLNGNATSSSSATNLQSGVKGNIPVQNASGITVFIPNGTSGQVLTSGGAGTLPSWVTQPAVNDGILSVNSTNHITGSATFTANQSGNTTLTLSSDATPSSVINTIVSRDATGAFSASTITANLNGNATSSTSATNLSGGSINTIPVQTSTGTTNYIPVGTTGQILVSNGTSAIPSWTNAPTVGNGTLTITGDSFVNTSGSFTANQSTNSSISVTTNATSANTASTIMARDSANSTNITTLNANTVNNPSGILTITGSGGCQTSGKDIDLGGGSLTHATTVTGANSTNMTISASAGNAVIIGGSSQINVGASGTTEITKLKPDLLVDTVANSTGANGDVYSSTATGTKWITPTSTNTNNALVVRDATGNFSASTITASLNGNASSATQVYVAQDSANADYQIPILSSAHTVAGNYGLKVDANTGVLTYNTNSHTLKPSNISLSGTLADASASVGSAGQLLSSTGTGTSWVSPSSVTIGTASNVVTTINNSSPSGYYVPFVAGTGVDNVQYDNLGMIYVPSTGNLSSTSFTGHLIGNADTSTTSTNQTINNTIANATYYPSFYSGTSGDLPAYTDSGFTFNPSTNNLSASQFTSTVATGTPPFTVSSTTQVNNLNAQLFAGHTLGYFYTGGSAKTGTGSLVLQTSPTLITPDLGTPTAGVLTNCTGTATGLTAGDSKAIDVTGTTTLGTYYIPFVNSKTGTSLTVYGDNNLANNITYNPNTQTLSALNITGNLSGSIGLPISTGVSGLGTNVATFLATPTSANLAACVTGETGTGNLVFATSPTLVTPLLGTPTSGTLTNCTGLPISSGVSGLGLGVATFLATPTSANLAAAVTGETGTGALVFGTSPTLVTPNLGTPSSGILTNCTGTAAGLTAGSAVNASSSDAVNTLVNSLSGTNYLVFASGTSGAQTPWVQTALNYNPVTGAFNVGGSTGNLTALYLHDRTTTANTLQVWSTGNIGHIGQTIGATNTTTFDITPTQTNVYGDFEVYPTTGGGNGGLFVRDRTNNTQLFGWYSSANYLNFYNLANANVGGFSPTGRCTMNGGFQTGYGVVNGIVGGGMDYIASGSLSGSGVYTIDNVFTTNYSSYRIVFYITSCSVANSTLTMDLVQSGVIDTTTNFVYSRQLAGNDTYFSSQTGWLLNSNLGTSTTATNNVTYNIFEISNPAQTGYTFLSLNTFCNNNGQSELINGKYSASKSFTGFTIGNSSATIVATYRIYGIA